MQISVLDGSNYFKGLLLLLRKDERVTPSELDLMRRVGATLGFEKEFYETAIRDILENTHIVDAPPSFSKICLAEQFVRDGIRIARSDNDVHVREVEWLEATAALNGLDPTVVRRELAEMHGTPLDVCRLEVEDLTVDR
ncbi:MAG: hypothetical protein AABY75_05940, partial [Bacteroidota bacterium]